MANKNDVQTFSTNAGDDMKGVIFLVNINNEYKLDQLTLFYGMLKCCRVV